jgi:hypothetical protein
MGPVPVSREELLDGFADGVGIIRVEVGGSIAADLVQHGNVGHKHRTSATHGLDGRQAEPFVERREDEADGLVVETNEFFVGYAAEILDNGLHGFNGFIPLILSKDPMAGTDDIEFAVGNILKGLNQTGEVLTRVEGGDSEGETLSGLSNLRQGSEEGFVGSIIDHCDVLLLEEGIKPQDFPFGELADGDDVLGGSDSQGCHDLIPPVIGT